MTPRRDQWLAATDAELLADCDIDTYRASGPGGQKRNKTSSAVRLRHGPSGLIVIAEESRSQHENRAKAVKRLKRAFALELRQAPLVGMVIDVDVSIRNASFWSMAAIALDVLLANDAQVSTAAESLGVSTAKFVSFLQAHPKLWQAANQLRQRFELKPLRGD